jgi:hypothetical protein
MLIQAIDNTCNTSCILFPSKVITVGSTIKNLCVGKFALTKFTVYFVKSKNIPEWTAGDSWALRDPEQCRPPRDQMQPGIGDAQQLRSSG